MAGTEIIDVKTTRRSEMIDITSLVRSAIRTSGVSDGLACIFCPHTTAAVTIQENTNPAVKHDMLEQLDVVVPRGAPTYTHAEDNADAHIKSSLVGASLSVIVENGRPVLGHWQALFFCEFDGPRSRRVIVRVVSE